MLTGEVRQDRLGFVYVTRNGMRLRELAPPGATREGVRVLTEAGDFRERGRRLGMEVLDAPEGLFWVTPDPPGQPVQELTAELLEQLALVVHEWHRQGLGHGALTLSSLRVHHGRLAVLDPLGYDEGDLVSLRALSGWGGSGPLTWAANAGSAAEVLRALRLQPGKSRLPPAVRECQQPSPPRHRGWVRCLAFREGVLFSGGEDRRLMSAGDEWDLGAWVCALASWGSRLVAVTQDGQVFEDGQVLLRWAAPALSFSPEGRLVVALSTGEVPEFGMHSTPIHDLAFSPDGQLLAVAAGTGLTLWTADGQLLEQRELGPVRSLAFLSDGRLVVAGSPLRILNLFSGGDTSTGRSTRCVAAGDAGFAAADADKTIWWHRLSDVAGLPLGQHTGEISCLAISPDGRWLASGGQDETVRVWAIPPPT